VAKAELKTRRVSQAQRKLDENHIEFTEQNNGTHFILYFDDEPMIDFWPTTGKFYDRSMEKRGRWMKQLLDHINGNYKD